jgi:para-aminobenzoate synthetase component 2
MQIAFIDHYDSFSYNVLDWLARAVAGSINVKRIVAGDETSLVRLKNSPVPVVISPGPGKPSDYPRTIDTIKSVMSKVPILGICLGHQMLGEIAGGDIIHAQHPWHGKTSKILVSASGWFTEELPKEFNAICYNSLVVKLPSSALQHWQILATNTNSEIMMMSHKTLPIASVQFHPESFASECGDLLAKNFVRMIAS